MEIIRGETTMVFRRMRASNRHWVFIKQEVLSALNDQLDLAMELNIHLKFLKIHLIGMLSFPLLKIVVETP